ncbi:hypothetical protein ACIONM_004258, partial [Escherichia coli]
KITWLKITLTSFTSAFTMSIRDKWHKKNPHGGGFKLCGEVTHLYQVFGNKITCGVLIFMPIK